MESLKNFFLPSPHPVVALFQRSFVLLQLATRMGRAHAGKRCDLNYFTQISLSPAMFTTKITHSHPLVIEPGFCLRVRSAPPPPGGSAAAVRIPISIAAPEEILFWSGEPGPPPPADPSREGVQSRQLLQCSAI